MGTWALPLQDVGVQRSLEQPAELHCLHVSDRARRFVGRHPLSSSRFHDHLSVLLPTCRPMAKPRASGAFTP